MARRRSGVILAVVLVVVGLLSLIMAGYLYFIRAEVAGIRAYGDSQQARLAAESGFEEVIAVLRVEKHNVLGWFDVPDRFRHGLVWAEKFDRQSDPVREFGSRLQYFESVDASSPAYRFSVVGQAYDAPDDLPVIRYGVTPESSKLNINTASEAQITDLLTPLLLDLEVENPQELIDALLDWRDTDSNPRENGAENDWYNALQPGPAYNAKDGPFDTVEELLLVKGFNAFILYGEDVNQNGVLDLNENDGDESFPYFDNADGVLNRGIAPFLTVFSRETDAALDNKPRINLNSNAAVVQAQMAEIFDAEAEEDTDVVQATLSAETRAFIAGIAGNQEVIGQMQSPAELYAGADQEETGGGEPNSTESIPEQLRASPVTLDEMPIIMDRFSTLKPEQASQPIAGLTNINTAPARVLRLIPNITPEAVSSILATRGTLEAIDLETTAWPLTHAGVPPAVFKAIAPYITTKAYQFHVEVLGYADHLKSFKRLEWVVEMVGPVPQIKYHRDLTRLGLAWPIDDDSVVTVAQ